MIKRSLRIGVVLGLLCLLIAAPQCGISCGVGHGAEEAAPKSGRVIDLYTQKEPYSGRGPNLPSDVFSPQEKVVLYAYVTYNDYPVQGKHVAFEVHGPINPVKNVSLTRTAVTGVDGIANVSFRIPWPDYGEEVVFGAWNVVAIVDIAEVAVNDTLTFEVGWIIELLRVETVDGNNVSKISFMRSEHISFRLSVRNIGMTDKVATLVVDVYDNCSVSLGQVVLEDERIQPGVKVYFVEDLLIPMWACLGVGKVYANAYTALPTLGGVPWCPGVSTNFLIKKLIVPQPVLCELPRWLLAFLFILAVLVGANLVVTVVFLLWWLKRKSEEDVRRAPTQGRRLSKTYKTCSECGREFHGFRAFCPYCFAYQG